MPTDRNFDVTVTYQDGQKEPFAIRCRTAAGAIINALEMVLSRRLDDADPANVPLSVSVCEEE
jgi:hypothetical protein